MTNSQINLFVYNFVSAVLTQMARMEARLLKQMQWKGEGLVAQTRESMYGEIIEADLDIPSEP